MACTLTQGMPLDCTDNFAGIKEFYISEFDNIDATATTIAAGVVTALTQVLATNFFTYKVRQGNGDFVSTPTKNLENGSLFFDAVGQMTILGLTAVKSEELRLLMANRAVVIALDFNGVYWIMGLENGAEFAIGGTNTGMTGRAAGDKYGYDLAFTAKETWLPLELDSTVFAGLTVV